LICFSAFSRSVIGAVAKTLSRRMKATETLDQANARLPVDEDLGRD
jgi:hypothetical protein